METNSPSSIKYRIAAVLITLIAGALAASLLSVTSWNPATAAPGVNYPGMPATITDYPQFETASTEPLSSFYTPPDPLPNLIPGTILKSEPIKDAPPGIRAVRIMYLSTRVDGKPVAVTGAYFDRDDPAPPLGRPLVGFAHGTVGLGRYCGVSQAPFKSGLTGVLFWDSQIQPLVAAGYAVVATDFQDMGAPGTPSYLVAQSEGYSVLDSMRAALVSFPSQLNANTQLLVGHSQGGQASLAAATLAASYSPDLAIRGTVSQAPGMIVGLPIVTKRLVASSVGASAAGRAEFIAYLTEAWSATYPGQVSADQILTPEGLTKLPLTGTMCGTPLSKQYDQPLSAYVKPNLPNSFVRLLNKNVPVAPISAPILFTQGLKDTTIVPQFTIGGFKTICGMGATAELLEFPNDDHTSLLLSGRTPVIDWMNDRAAGQPAPNSCSGRS